MPARAWIYIGSLVMSLPAKTTLPASGEIIPIAIRKLVVFPAPFLPKSPTISPASTVKETLSTTRRPL